MVNITNKVKLPPSGIPKQLGPSDFNIEYAPVWAETTQALAHAKRISVAAGEAPRLPRGVTAHKNGPHTNLLARIRLGAPVIIRDGQECTQLVVSATYDSRLGQAGTLGEIVASGAAFLIPNPDSPYFESDVSADGSHNMLTADCDSLEDPRYSYAELFDFLGRPGRQEMVIALEALSLVCSAPTQSAADSTPPEDQIA